MEERRRRAEAEQAAAAESAATAAAAAATAAKAAAEQCRTAEWQSKRRRALRAALAPGMAVDDDFLDNAPVRALLKLFSDPAPDAAPLE